MSNIIDRRKNTKGKSINNRQKFLRRVEDQIRKAIPDIVSQERIKDASGGGKVKVPVRGSEGAQLSARSPLGQEALRAPRQR